MRMFAAISCPSLQQLYIVNTNSTRPGTLLNASCPAGQLMATLASVSGPGTALTGPSSALTLCSPAGVWTPALQDCVGKHQGPVPQSNLRKF